MHEIFKAYKPAPHTMRTIIHAQRIIEDYQRQGLRMTLRQLYYQFVSLNLLPNDDRHYKTLSHVINRARQAGMIDWSAITDNMRKPVLWEEWSSVNDMVEYSLQSFRYERLKGQKTYVELWVEKDALASVLQPIAARYHIALMVNRGYSSASAMKETGDRLQERVRRYGSDRIQIFYLGDMDPSGEDMVRDIRKRLDRFCNGGFLVEWDGDWKPTLESDAARHRRKPELPISVKKIALTMDQVEEYNPPPNPAKFSDPRAKEYIAKYGRTSWEVDALSPAVTRTIIEDAFESVLDMSIIEEIKEREDATRERFLEVLDELGPMDSE